MADALRKLAPAKASIADIGSGPYGITPYIKRPVVGVDIEFPQDVHPSLRPVTISPSDETLPFSNEEFNVVVSVDTLEHMDDIKRSLLITEMIRIAQDLVVINVPAGEDARDQDLELNGWYKKKHGADYQFLKEHLNNPVLTRDFIEKTIAVALEAHGKDAIVTVTPNCNIPIRSLLMKLYFSTNPISRMMYILLALPLFFARNHLNFGKCYRLMFTMKIHKIPPT